MLRRIALTAATAIAGLVLVSQTAHALSSATVQCVRSTRAAFRSCQLDCRTELQANLPTCFGPGSQCAANCQTTANACLDDVADTRAACSDGCIDTRDTAIQACRDAGTDAATETACINAARVAAQACRQACRDAGTVPQRACNTTFNDCLESCASIPPQ